MTYEAYYDYYESRGYFFDRALLTTYALSLYSKPFVILSGISGTGKTKIAQFFNFPATDSQLKPISTSSPAAVLPGNWILMTVTAAVTTGDGRANFKFKDLDALLSPTEIAAIKPKIDALKRAGNEDNICDPFDFVIVAHDGSEIRAKAYLQRASSPLLRIRFKSKQGESSPYDSTPYFVQNHKVGDVLKLEKIGDKRLKIASINDKAVVQKAEELESEEKLRVKSSCFISVRSDWTDATSMFGYYNLIDQKYHITPLISFILTAHEHPDLPFFLILDEMNLAKVEHYFSDFLSCLESRHLENGVLQQEPIRLVSGSGWTESNDSYFDLIPAELNIPPNLFVTGTVNIDESTYMFSAKVVDRANVIELNSVDIENYGKPKTALASAGETFILNRFPDFSKLAISSSDDYQKLDTAASTLLRQVHGILSEYQLHFGYRVINEVSAYINNAMKYCEPHAGLLDEALDFQLVQKILPKLSGPQSKLEAPIKDVLALLTGSTPTTPMEALLSVAPGTTKYPRAVDKLQRMARTLVTHGFANYIE